MGKTVKCQLNGKTSRKFANGRDINYYEKQMDPGLHLYTGTSRQRSGTIFHNIQTCLTVYTTDLRTIGPLVMGYGCISSLGFNRRKC